MDTLQTDAGESEDAGEDHSEKKSIDGRWEIVLVKRKEGTETRNGARLLK
jgi:hypothetical protein